MIPLRAPEVIDALAWWVHIQAHGESMRLPDVQARSHLACLGMLSVAPSEVIAQLRAADGGLDALGRLVANRLAALGVSREVINQASARATLAVNNLALATFSTAPAPEPAKTEAPVLPEPPDGAPPDVLMAYHAALKAVNAYATAAKAATKAA